MLENTFTRFGPEDLGDIMELQRVTRESRWHWSEADTRTAFTDVARGHGENTLIVRRGDQLVAAAGWVELGVGAGEYYIAPFLVRDRDAAELVLERLLPRARKLLAGAGWVRTSLVPGEHSKEPALRAAGFAPAFDFIELSRPVTGAPAAPSFPPELFALTPDQVEAEPFARLYNTAFARVPNAPPVTPDMALEGWHDERNWSEASRVLADRDGVYQAFLLVRDDGYIESVGVASAWHRRGLARGLIQRALGLAAACGLEALTSTCASTNVESLALHRAMGFVEIGRFATWQLDL